MRLAPVRVCEGKGKWDRLIPIAELALA